MATKKRGDQAKGGTTPSVTIYPVGEASGVPHALEATDAEAAVRADQGHGTPARAQLVALVQRFAALINDGRLEELDEVFAHDVVDHDPFPGQAPGLEGMREAMARFREGFPDLHGDAGEPLVDGDRVAFPMVFTGTHAGPSMGIPASQRRVRFSGLFIFRIEGGRVVDSWGAPDGINLLEGIGASPWAPDRPIPGVQGDADAY